MDKNRTVTEKVLGPGSGDAPDKTGETVDPELERQFLSPLLVEHGGVSQEDVDRLVAGMRASDDCSFIQYLLDVKFLNSFGARVIRAAMQGARNIDLPGTLAKLAKMGKLQVPAELKPVERPAVKKPQSGEFRLPGGRTDLPSPGTVLGRLTLQEILGEGATSLIYRGYHQSLGVSVAVKVFKHADHSQAAIDRFMREARILAKIDHPNIVRVIDVDKWGEVPYIVFELVGAVTLEEALEAFGTINDRRICKMGARLASGLAAAHKLGLQHRDIKPANILLRKDGEPKLADFGLASIRWDDSEEKGQVAGTPAFMAPEVVVQSNDIDHRADMYSLGATLYFAAVGHPPFYRSNLTELLMAHVNEEPTPLHIADPFIDEQLSAVISKLLSKRPGDRYDNWDEVQQAFLDAPPARRRNTGRTAAAALTTSIFRPQQLAGVVVADRYRTDRFVTADAAGIVYVATDLSDDDRDRCLLRIFRQDHLESHSATFKSFERVAEAVSGIEHPNVLRAGPVERLENMTIQVSSYFDGFTLAELMERRGGMLPREEALRVLKGLIKGIEAVHKAGVVHRDINPTSVLVNDALSVKVTAIGTAMLTAAFRTSYNGFFVGTLDYVSPEVCQGLPLDTLSDIYSIGCVAFELLSGKPPFRRSTVLAALQAQVAEPAPTLLSVMPEIPEELSEIVARCLVKEPTERFDDVPQLLRALDDATAGMSAEGSRPV